MPETLQTRLLASLRQAAQYNANLLVRPEVILWPDPDGQWATVVPRLRDDLPALLTLGEYAPGQRQGPALWLKCLVARTLPEADWPADTVPVLYLPGVSRAALRQATAGLGLQPLVEYLYTGTVWTQENGKEWTVLAFLTNAQAGLGLRVAADAATRETVVRALPAIFEEPEALYRPNLVDADYLYSLLVPDAVPNVLAWLSRGEAFLTSLAPEKRVVFETICRTRYDFTPDPAQVRTIAEKLGSQRGPWRGVWQHYANAPHKYPEIAGLLRLATPVDLGRLSVPAESWPPVNDEHEDRLRAALLALGSRSLPEAARRLAALDDEHAPRRDWVWAELGQAPLAQALAPLRRMSEVTHAPLPSATLDELKTDYLDRGYRADQALRQAWAAVRSERDKDALRAVLGVVYRPWLDTLARKFQERVGADDALFTRQRAVAETADFVLFVDALRYELARDFGERLTQRGYGVAIDTGWSALPSLTPTAKPAVSPVAPLISESSVCDEFRPQLKTGKALQTAVFREALAQQGFTYVTQPADIRPGGRYWQEIGDTDTKGHQEGAELVRRVDELFEHLCDVLETAAERGIGQFKIVTDHGWLLLPGGLPKESLSPDLVETRWGRCALLKEGVNTPLPHVPWRWNPAVFIAYAPGISFFKKNEEYAHGGLSLHECLVPTLRIDAPVTTAAVALKSLRWVNLRCQVETEHAPDGYRLDLRTKAPDAATSVLLTPPVAVANNRASLLADDAHEARAATLVLLDETGRILATQLTTVGG